jgi:hypothetical protein
MQDVARAKGIIFLLVSLIVWMIVGCSAKAKPDASVIQIANRMGSYPFMVGFGATLQELMAAEGEAKPSRSEEFFDIYSYTVEWHGRIGTLNYLHFKAQDSLVAFSFDIPMLLGVDLQTMLEQAGTLYHKADIHDYEVFFELDEAEATRLFNSEEHQHLFFKDTYQVDIRQSEDNSLINMVYSYLDLTHDHEH